MQRLLPRLAVLAVALALPAVIAPGVGFSGTRAAAGATDHTGVVGAITGNTLTITTAKGKSFTFGLASGTAFKHLNDRITATDVKPGMTVNVTFALSGTTLTATEVVVGLVTPAGTFFSTSVKGSVTTIASNGLTVTTSKGKIVSLGAGSALRVERMGQKLALADVKQGDSVKARFAIAADGSLTATDIAIGVQSTVGILYANVEKGIIVSAAAGHLEVDTGSPPTLPFAIVTATKVQRLGRTIPTSALAAGMKVKVSFAVAAGGVLQARSVDVGVKSAAGTLYAGTETGVAKATSPTRLTIATKKGDVLAFGIGPSTTFSRDGLAAGRGTIHAGDAVKIKLAVLPSGALFASAIKAGRKFRGTLVFASKQKGVVVRAAGRTIVLRTAKGKTINLSVARPADFQVAGLLAQASDVVRGDAVKVKILQLGATVATSVHVVGGSTGFALVGKVLRPSGQSLVVRVASLTERGTVKPGLRGHPITVALPASVLIRTRGGTSGSNGLHTGATVHIIGRLAGKRLVARHVIG